LSSAGPTPESDETGASARSGRGVPGRRGQAAGGSAPAKPLGTRPV
jgi:hypothetical protein